MNKKRIYSLIYILGLVPLLVLEFLYHRITVFMMDDLWYATNLETGEPLSSFMDVIQSQIWHYLNWGGRSITHGVLQCVLMGGELFADICNLLVTILLVFLCTRFVKKEYRFAAAGLVGTMMIAFNPNIQYSMFWQSGSVNYLYSTCWIFTFLYIYFREFSEGPVKPLWGVNYWMIPLALITGWSNENMGPASFCFAVMAVFLLRKKKKLRIRAWMIEGILFSLLGSAICILAPGNFVRSEFVTESSLLETIKDRALSMLTGGCGFLFASFLVLLFLMVVSVSVCGQRLRDEELILLIMAILAYGAMLLSPHFPDRAAFGIMMLNLILITRMNNRITDFHPEFSKYTFVFYLTVLADAILILLIRVI